MSRVNLKKFGVFLKFFARRRIATPVCHRLAMTEEGGSVLGLRISPMGQNVGDDDYIVPRADVVIRPYILSPGEGAKKSPRGDPQARFFIRLQVLNYTSSMIAISAASPRRAPVRVTRV